MLSVGASCGRVLRLPYPSHHQALGPIPTERVLLVKKPPSSTPVTGRRSQAMILTTCAACAKALDHDAPAHCVNCQTRYCSDRCLR